MDLTKVPSGKNAYWHDVLWYFFHNDGKFQTFAQFRKQLSAKKGYRVDHMGGLPSETNAFRLELLTAKESAEQGGSQRRCLKRSGESGLSQNRLAKRRPENMNGFAYARQPRRELSVTEPWLQRPAKEIENATRHKPCGAEVRNEWCANASRDFSKDSQDSLGQFKALCRAVPK